MVTGTDQPPRRHRLFTNHPQRITDFLREAAGGPLEQRLAAARQAAMTTNPPLTGLLRKRTCQFSEGKFADRLHIAAAMQAHLRVGEYSLTTGGSPAAPSRAPGCSPATCYRSQLR